MELLIIISAIIIITIIINKKMAIVPSYPQAQPTVSDTVLGVQYKQNEKPIVKQFGVQDIVDLIPTYTTELPYKSYVGLLTETGAAAVLGIVNEPLTIGVTYVIVDDGSGGGHNFINVGAPNNNFGTYFVATGTTPTSWGVDVFLQYNTGAPTVKVLENNVGYIYFTYIDGNEYGVLSNGLFTTDKTYINFSGFYGGVNITNSYQNSSFIDITGTNDSSLTDVPIEIRVYN
jgi:hypothetical protein